MAKNKEIVPWGENYPRSSPIRRDLSFPPRASPPYSVYPNSYNPISPTETEYPPVAPKTMTHLEAVEEAKIVIPILQRLFKYKAILGWDINGEEVRLSFPEYDHVLISGPPNRGKTKLLDTIMWQLAYGCNTRELGFIMFDPKRDGFRVSKHLPDSYLIRPPVSSPREAEEALISLVHVIDSMKLGKNARLRDMVIVAIDEISDLLIKPENKQNLKRLIIEGAGVGIHVIAVAQEQRFPNSYSSSLEELPFPTVLQALDWPSLKKFEFEIFERDGYGKQLSCINIPQEVAIVVLKEIFNNLQSPGKVS